MAWTSQQLLAAIAQAAPDECITEARMAELTGLTASQVEDCALKLRKHGFLERVGHGCHRLTEAGLAAWQQGVKLTSGPRGPQANGQRHRDPGQRQRVWNVLRQGRKVSTDDIVMLAVAGDERDPVSNVGKYLRALTRAGYLRRLPRRELGGAPSSNGTIRVQLVSDTGPAAPVVRVSRGVVYDPNLDREIPLARELTPVNRRRP